MDLLETSLISGVVSGLLYALAGVGLVVIYRVSGYVSFAQGDVAAVALYLGFWLHQGGARYCLAVAVLIAGPPAGSSALRRGADGAVPASSRRAMATIARRHHHPGPRGAPSSAVRRGRLGGRRGLRR